MIEGVFGLSDIIMKQGGLVIVVVVVVVGTVVFREIMLMTMMKPRSEREIDR